MDNYVIQKDFDEHLKYAKDFWDDFVTDAKTYTLAQAGYTWTEAERQALIKDGREPLELNIMRRQMQFYSGYLRDTLNSLVIGPVEGSDQETADQLTMVSDYIWDKQNGYSTFLDSADECFKAGMSLTGLYMDYSKDFINGDIGFYKRTYNQFYIDPTFTNINLSDCGFIIMRDLIDKSRAKSLLPFIDPEFIDDIHRSIQDNTFVDYKPDFNTYNRNRDLLTYDQYYQRTTRMRKMLIDRRTGFFIDIEDKEKEEIEKLEMGIYRFEKLRQDANFLGESTNDIPRMEIKSVERPYIAQHVILSGELAHSGDDKTGIVETYPCVPNLCYFEPSIWRGTLRVQGIASTQWSMQRQFNKRHMKIIDMMDSDISTGFKYILGTVPDPEELQQTGQNRLIGISAEDNPLGLGAVEQLQGGGANPALFEYQKVLDNLSLTLANINETSLGTDEGGNTQVSGKLAQIRLAQGQRSSRKVFDNIETAQQLLGTLVLKTIQNKYPPEKIERILGEQPTSQFFDQRFEQYDAQLKQGVRTKSQKDAYYFELVNLARDGIVDVPQSAITRALQMTGMSDLQEAIEEQDQQKAEQQKKIDMQEQMLLRMQNAKIEQDTALAQERRARVVSDIALASERSSEAEENRAQAALARAKTITEIASMQDDRIIKVLQFVDQLEQQEQVDREQIDEKIHAQADAINSETSGSAENKSLNQSLDQEV